MYNFLKIHFYCKYGNYSGNCYQVGIVNNSKICIDITWKGESCLLLIQYRVWCYLLIIMEHVNIV